MAKTAAKNELKKPGNKLNYKALSHKWWNQKYLQFMVIPGLIWMLIFNYMPMGGIVIAFKKFRITKPISEAPWVGFKYFRDFFSRY